MRAWLRHKRIRSALAGVALLAACSTSPAPTPTAESTSPPAPTAEAATELVPVTVQVNTDLAQSPFDEPRQALVPAGWTLSAWARFPRPRLAAWAPDGALLISVPSSGQVLHLAPSDAGPRESVLVDGLDQPHGLAFAGNTLYVAESDQVDAYDYADGAAINQRTVAANLPDAKSPDLRGAYSHALKSVAVGPDGAVYFSIGSTGKHLRRRPRGDSTACDNHAGPTRRRSGATVFDGRAQRHRARYRTGWLGVDGGQQSRQHRQPADRRGHHGLRQRPSARGSRQADVRARIGLALLQS